MTQSGFPSEEFDLEQELRDLYNFPGTGYWSIESLYRKVKDDGFDVTRQQVRHLYKNKTQRWAWIGEKNIL